MRNLHIASNHNRSRIVGIAALAVGMLCWGTTPVLLRRLTPFIDGWTANGLRYPMAAVLYWPLLLISLRSHVLTWRLAANCLIPAGCALGGQTFWALAHYELPASEIGFYIRASAVWTILGSMLLFHDERRLLAKPTFWIGIGLIVCGFALLAGSARPEASAKAVISGGDKNLGVTYMLCCGLFFGAYVVSVRKCLPSTQSVLSFGVVAQFVSFGLIIGMFIAGDISKVSEVPAMGWWLMISSSILGVAVGHVMLYTAIQNLGAAITSSCQSAMPFVTAVVASMFLAETLSHQQWAGGVVMVAGAVLLLLIKDS